MKSNVTLIAVDEQKVYGNRFEFIQSFINRGITTTYQENIKHPSHGNIYAISSEPFAENDVIRILTGKPVTTKRVVRKPKTVNKSGIDLSLVEPVI